MDSSSFDFEPIHCCKLEHQWKSKKRIENSVNPDEMTCYGKSNTSQGTFFGLQDLMKYKKITSIVASWHINGKSRIELKTV